MKPDSYIESTLPNDDELRELTAYVGGFMSEADEKAYDVRLAEDDAFFARISPMLKIWYSLPPSVIEAGEQLKARIATSHNLVVDPRRLAPVWGRGSTTKQRRTQVRWHVLTALGSAASIKPLMAAAGLAAAVVYAYVNIPRERSFDNAAPRAMAIAPADTTPKPPTQSPPAKTTAVAVTAKRPHATKRAPPPIQEAQIEVVPTLPVDSAEAPPPLPSLLVSFTPSKVIAQNDALVLRGSDIGAPPRDLGGTRNVIPVPGALTGKGAPGDLPMPKGGISSWPRRIWDWLNNH
jgi:hypothetical protein